MKKLSTILLGLCLMLPLGSFAKDKDMGKEVKLTGIVTDPMCAKSGDKAKMTNSDCAKKCAADGKYAFVNDKDGSVWAIQNSEAVKGHEGHHVTVDAHVDKKDKSIHVMDVAMADMAK
jgi:hypothetical protein